MQQIDTRIYIEIRLEWKILEEPLVQKLYLNEILLLD